MTERRSSLDLDAAMAALEGRPRTVAQASEGEGLAKAARLSRRAPHAGDKRPRTEEGAVTRIRNHPSGRVHMFSTRASVETLNALYSLAREERRTITELFDEAVNGLVEKRRSTR